MRVFTVFKIYRGGTSSYTFVVHKSEYDTPDDLKELAERRASSWAERHDTSGRNYGYNLKWQEVEWCEENREFLIEALTTHQKRLEDKIAREVKTVEYMEKRLIKVQTEIAERSGNLEALKRLSNR